MNGTLTCCVYICNVCLLFSPLKYYGFEFLYKIKVTEAEFSADCGTRVPASGALGEWRFEASDKPLRRRGFKKQCFSNKALAIRTWQRTRCLYSKPCTWPQIACSTHCPGKLRYGHRIQECGPEDLLSVMATWTHSSQDCYIHLWISSEIWLVSSKTTYKEVVWLTGKFLKG